MKRLPFQHFDAFGFTLVELMIAIVILGILIAMAVPNFLDRQKMAFDSTLRSDLHNSFLAISDYSIIHDGNLPASSLALETQTNFELSPNVQWDTYALEVIGAEPSVSMQIFHPRANNMFRAHYPALGTDIIRVP